MARLLGSALLAGLFAFATGCGDGGSANEVCTDNQDNDGDGLVDCADPDCAGHASCSSVEVCDNDEDDDGDDLVDCDDPDCAGHAACASVEVCDNFVDDDGDELADCDDPDCDGDPACTNLCVAYGAATIGDPDVDDRLPNFFALGGTLNGSDDFVIVQLYAGFGVFEDGIAPGTYTISGEETNYATCGLCVLTVTEEGAIYMATAGSVTIGELAPDVDVTLSNIRLVHVTIDEETYVSTPHADGCEATLASAAFDIPAPPVECGADDDYGDVTLTAQAVVGDGLPQYLVVRGNLNDDPDRLRVELIDGFGVFTNGIEPGTYTIEGDDLNYATCGLCVLVLDQAGQPYMATGGSVTITSVSPLQATFSALTFEHVTINGQTYESTPHPDGCTSAIGSTAFTFAAEVCDNEIDDDGDGRTDCDDADCLGTELCPISCKVDESYGDATVSGQYAEADADLIWMFGSLNDDPDYLVIDLWDGFGVFADGIAPGTYTLEGDELDMLACGLCVYLIDEAEDGFYMATGGTATVTALSPNVQVSIQGVTFLHYENASTPHADACASAIASASFDVAPE